MHNFKGFTLTELLIVVAIIGILASVAYPSYNSFVLKGARAEAMSSLLDIANKQEQFYVDNHEYTGNLALLGVPVYTETGLYEISIALVGTDSFTATATGYEKPALNDNECSSLSINDVSQKTSTGTGTSTVCWSK